MKARNPSLFSGEYLPLDFEQEFAGQSVVKGLGDRHSRQNTVNKEVDTLIVKPMSDLFKLGNFVLVPLFNHCRMMLLKAIAE